MNTQNILLTVPTSQIVDLYNEFADSPVKRFASKTKAVERTTALLNDSGMVVRMEGDELIVEPATNPETPTPAPKKRGRPSEFSDDLQIDICAEGNPKRKGTASYKRFALYRAGMTVGEYREAAEKAFPGKGRSRANADLFWDIKKGFIVLNKVS